MKNALLTFLLLCPIFLWADAWDNLTLQQAEQVCEFLNTDPYILDYCDCCDYEGEYATKVYLMKVKSTKIITCDWNPEYYSVIADMHVLAEIPYIKEGPDINSAFRYKSKEELLITMNYTWIYNKHEVKAAPIYTIIPYDIYGENNANSGYCKAFINFPSPKSIKNRKYKKWYNKRFQI
ncbi:hypothetical protein ACFFU1_09665 [Algibacter miyuki]|uniref:Uncharacterized protein n=1 Tax=Algibacter miyuki TaxID=1306933 RepID=A0ABV5GZW5_9FLAO|nr:hypothetical protein [Algibacter miyuki]MDN3666636.1 hypothetical protein [Algibacter miyuki]